MGDSNESDAQYSLLLIEDDLVDVELVSRYLNQVRSPRFVVENTQHLQKAIHLLTENTYDAVLLDLNLRDSCGLETIDLVMSVWENGPIIVLTGMDEDCLGVDAMRHGAQDYLVKSGLSANLLSRSIRYAIERHYLINYLDSMKQANEQLLPDFCKMLRDPMSELLTAASELCDDRKPMPPEQDESIQRITASGTRIVDLIKHACPCSATAEVV